MNRYPVPDLASQYYTNTKKITYTVIPYLLGRFRVADYGQGGNEYMLDVQLVPPNPMNIVITAGTRVMDRPQYIRDQLDEIIFEAVFDATLNDINNLIDEDPNSPPIKVVAGQDIKTAIKGRSYFEVIRINNKAVGGRFGK